MEWCSGGLWGGCSLRSGGSGAPGGTRGALRGSASSGEGWCFPRCGIAGLPREGANRHRLWPKDQGGQDVLELGVGCGPVIDPLLPQAHFVPHLISLKARCWLPSLRRLLRHSPPSHQSPCRSRRQSWGDCTAPWGCSWSPVVMPAASATLGSTPRWECTPFLYGFAGLSQLDCWQSKELTLLYTYHRCPFRSGCLGTRVCWVTHCACRDSDGAGT